MAGRLGTEEPRPRKAQKVYPSTERVAMSTGSTCAERVVVMVLAHGSGLSNSISAVRPPGILPVCEQLARVKVMSVAC